MYGGKYRYMLAIFLALIIFLASSCGAVSSEDDLLSAIEDGIIVQPGEAMAWDANLELVTAGRMNITRTTELAPVAMFPVLHPLTFQRYGGIFDESLITEVGTVVQKGDMLASQTFQPYPTLESGLRLVNRQRLLFQIDEFESNFHDEYTARNQEIAELRAALAQSSDPVLAGLKLERLIMQLERFLFESNQTRQNFENQLHAIGKELYEERLYAPFYGMIPFISTLSVGRRVPARHILFGIADYRFIHFRVNTGPDILKFGTMYTIREAENVFEFEATVANDPFTIPRRGSSFGFYLVPYDMDAFFAAIAEHGFTIMDVMAMSFRITAEEIIAFDTITIPAHAIRREETTEYVLIYYEGRLARRVISRGIQHMGYVEVLEGLSEGQRVALP